MHKFFRLFFSTDNRTYFRFNIPHESYVYRRCGRFWLTPDPTALFNDFRFVRVNSSVDGDLNSVTFSITSLKLPNVPYHTVLSSVPAPFISVISWCSPNPIQSRTFHQAHDRKAPAGSSIHSLTCRHPNPPSICERWTKPHSPIPSRQCTHIANTVYVLQIFRLCCISLFSQCSLSSSSIQSGILILISLSGNSNSTTVFNNIMYIRRVKFLLIHRHRRYTVLCLKFSL